MYIPLVKDTSKLPGGILQWYIQYDYIRVVCTCVYYIL